MLEAAFANVHRIVAMRQSIQAIALSERKDIVEEATFLEQQPSHEVVGSTLLPQLMAIVVKGGTYVRALSV